jgi:hypothetical protein
LPAQKGSVLAGPAFANAVVGGGLARILLSPAAPGPNRMTVLTGGHAIREAISSEETPRGGAAPGPDPRSVTVSLACDCSARTVGATLARRDGLTWAADVDLPAAGVWRASLVVDGGQAVAPVALRVDTGRAPGAPPVVVAAPGDLSGPDARRCRSFQLGMVLALGFLNADGGIDGRKVVVRSADDGGDPARAAALAHGFEQAGVHAAAPCGAGSGAAVSGFGPDLPVIVADPQTPVIPGQRIFRLAGDPYAEGWALARTLSHNTLAVNPEAPRAVVVVADEGDPNTSRAVAGLRAGLAVDPELAAAAEGKEVPSTADVKVTTILRRPGEELAPMVQAATVSRTYSATFLRSDPADTAAALDTLSDDDLVRTNAVVVPNSHFDEDFYRASRYGRRGEIIVLGEVAPDSRESLVYTNVASSIFSGERPTIDGFRGFVAGRMLAEALRAGTGAAGLAGRLRHLDRILTRDKIQDGAVSGWSPVEPAAGSWRFFLYKGSFISGSLRPGASAEPGRFFDEGSWSRVVTGNVGLCGPQDRLKAPTCLPSGPPGSEKQG